MFFYEFVLRFVPRDGGNFAVISGPSDVIDSWMTWCGENPAGEFIERKGVFSKNPTPLDWLSLTETWKEYNALIRAINNMLAEDC